MQELHMKAHGMASNAPSELLFNTEFDYFFRAAAKDGQCLVKSGPGTAAALNALADAMVDPNAGGPITSDLDSTIPAVMTYLGQFIDHDLTARTDRESGEFQIADPGAIQPVNPDTVVATLKNGRRPVFDLDSVYGDGPALVRGSKSIAQSVRGDGIYAENLRMRLARDGRTVDLPRVRRPGDESHGAAIIGDERNDENIQISQLHAAILALHNRVANALPSASYDTDAQRYIRARQLVRWAYQYIVANEYLKEVCDPCVVADVKANGPRYLGPASGRGGLFMPLEFSVAGFRFGHSMIRPSYRLNSRTAHPIDVMDLLFGSRKHLVEGDGRPELDPSFRIDWDHFVRGGDQLQFARRIDTRIARGLFTLPSIFGGGSVLGVLARRNLLRSYLLSIPTGQSVAQCFGYQPLCESDLVPSAPGDAAIASALRNHELASRTPLWFYVLREAQVQQDGRRLGEVGSRLVAETLWGLLVNDQGSYLHHRHDAAVRHDGIAVMPNVVVETIGELLTAARVRD